MTAAERAVRSEEADRLCRSAFSSALGDVAETGVALVAVGGYGRRELAPFSDLDVVLVHDAAVDVRETAQKLWYPLWDAGAKVDHAVRALGEVTGAAADDVRVALGLLDARHLAGDPAVTLRLRTDVLSRWRRDARTNLPRVRELVRERSLRVGELAHASVPDLKESTGGLRDATVLNALVATWLVDVPHVDLERCRLQLLDVRDALQTCAGRGSDRVTPELWGPLAERLGLPDDQGAQRRLRQLGRRTAHLSRLTWSRVDNVLTAPPSGTRGRVSDLVPLAPGVALSGGEVVLDRGADPARDPVLLLRVADAAAREGGRLAPATAARLARTAGPLPTPWPTEARDLLVRLLAAGQGLLAVWETLDETGAVELVLPEWRRIWLLPHASPVHRFTVDRHVVETCIEAAGLIRRVTRPDLLLVAALLHDIGKGGHADHSQAGEPVAAAVAARMGFDADDRRTVARLVRRHLLLSETATTRDLDDPATVEAVAGAVHDVTTLDLLEALTEADARATGPQAWTAWRATLVTDLARRVRSVLAATPGPAVPAAFPARGPTPGSSHDGEEAATLPPDFRLADGADVAVPGAAGDAGTRDPAHLRVEFAPEEDGTRLDVAAADRVGLMADIAGALSLLRMSVRSARAWTVGGLGVSRWRVDARDVDTALVCQRLQAVVTRAVDPGARIRARPRGLPPTVIVRHDASREATVLEVRTDDRLGVVYLAARALAGLDVAVRSAHLSTYGPQALDVFYVQEPGAGPLTDERAATAAHAVRTALEGVLDEDRPR